MEKQNFPSDRDNAERPYPPWWKQGMMKKKKDDVQSYDKVHRATPTGSSDGQILWQSAYNHTRTDNNLNAHSLVESSRRTKDKIPISVV
jgi:hypothetical protein